MIFFLFHNHRANQRYETMLGSVAAAGSFNGHNPGPKHVHDDAGPECGK